MEKIIAEASWLKTIAHSRARVIDSVLHLSQTETVQCHFGLSMLPAGQQSLGLHRDGRAASKEINPCTLV